MKILFFSPYFHPYTSGITTYPKALFSRLAGEHDITVLCFPHQAHLRNTEQLDGMTIRRIPYLFKISKGFISPQSLIVFLNRVRKTDVVFLNIPNFEGLMLAIFARLMRKRIVSIFHCQVDLGNGPLERLISFFLQTSVNIQMSLSDRIVAYTQEYAQRVGVTKRYGKKIVTALPPVPEPTVDAGYLEELRGLVKGHEAIGYAGRISREKGLEYLVKAVERLRSEKRKCMLLFAGPFGKDVAGEQDYYARISGLLEKYAIPHVFLGNLSGGKLGAFYKAIRVLVLPSTNRTEAFGMVQAEAMMMGSPVVVTNLPGVRVPVSLTHMGTIVKPQNSSALAGAILAILKKPATVSTPEMVANAKKLFDIEPTIETYRDILGELAVMKR
jgi:glycosyltransferase involved in cell wall biosynthesis